MYVILDPSFGVTTTLLSTNPTFFIKNKSAKIKKFDHYLGKEIPPDIAKLENELFKKIRLEKYGNKLDQIKENYSKRQNKLTSSGKAKEIESFGIEFTYNTQKIEGSTLTLQETSLLLEKGITPGGKPAYDVIEASNHKRILNNILNGNFSINLETILTWHKELFSGTKHDIAGNVRDVGVKISGSKFVPPAPVELQFMLDEFFAWYNRNSTILNPVDLAG